MIFQHSRYTNTDMCLEDGLITFSRRNLNKFNLMDCPVHTVIEDETLDYIASKYYNEPKLWWVILEANLGTIKDYFDVKPGTKLKIPKYSDVLGVVR